jgi:hypothetical protein
MMLLCWPPSMKSERIRNNQRVVLLMFLFNLPALRYLCSKAASAFAVAYLHAMGVALVSALLSAF